jgi:uncharacterized protein YcbK (DUF882 family)
MLMRNEESGNNERDEVELSRRSFFSRLALGTVLSIAMPGVVHAAKSAPGKDDKKQGITKSSARLPKRRAKSAEAASKVSKKSAHHATGKLQKVSGAKAGKSSKTGAMHSHKSSTAKHQQHKGRVRDVYAGKKQGNKARIHHAGLNHKHAAGRSETIIRPEQRSISLADRGRLASHRALSFQNTHTGDKLSLTYFEKGRYLSDAMDEISFMLRDYRTNEVHPIDPELLDQLYDLKQILGLHQPFDFVCGYRSPLTNARLHAERAGVANNSFHIYGRAVDVRIQRYDLRRIHNAALAMHRGGVGYYPGSNFIHLDTGTFRTWTL